MDTTPLLPRPANSSGRTDSHPIYLRACHSPWRLIDQPLLLFLRLILAGYLSAVFGVSLKYKLENEDGHTRWRIPFQFSTVSFVLQWVYHLVVTLWTAMHLAFPKALEENPEDCHGHRLRTRILQFLSPPNEATCPARRYLFSMFYTMSHVFPFMNTLIYWGILVPSGHGGFKPPNFPHNHTPPAGNASALYDPNKGLFEEDDIKAFSIINVWTITTVIGLIEIAGLNSIRRPTPVAAHVAGVMFASGAYLAWAGIGKLATGHSGLFFLDPDLMSNIPGAVIAACIAFITVYYPTRIVFSYFYGLIAMRETMAAVHHRESSE